MTMRDVRYALRMLWKTPAFTVVVTLSLALGIGANTALFSLVDSLLLRSLTVSNPAQLVFVTQTFSGMGIRKSAETLPKPTFDYVREHNPIFSEIVGFARLIRPAVSLEGVADSSRQVEHISTNFFRDLGVTPMIGRAPEAADGAVAVVSYGLWRTRYGGDPRVLGRALTVEGQQYMIVGVAPPRFFGLSFDTPADIWIPAPAEAPLQMIARLKPEVSPQQGEAAMQVLFRQLARVQPNTATWDDERMRAELLPAGKGLSQVRTQYRGPLLALAVLVTLVLLITCTNVANLLTLRNSARGRELSVRAALGAGRRSLLATSLIESAMLAAMGGALGLAFAKWGVSIILSMLPVAMVPETLAFTVDARVLAFAGGVSLVSALFFGLLPAWRATRGDLTAGLRATQSTPTKRMRRLGRVLVACQVGLSILLLVGAGLFVRTLTNLARIDVGFNPDGLIQVLLDSRAAGYGEGQIGPLYSLLLERVAAIPGVTSVSGIRNPLMRGGLSRTSFRSLGPNRPLGPDDVWDSAEVGPSFFEAMSIPLVRGRSFTAADFQAARPIVVVSEAFAKHYFPDQDPTVGEIGQMIVGVAKDARLPSVRTQPGPMMYMLAQPNRTNRLDALEVRIAGHVEAVAPRIRDEILRVNPRLFVAVNPMRREIERTIASERLVAAVSGFFGGLGLLLASIGIFGIAASSVAQRTTELGIRMALGADRWAVIRESMRDTTMVFGVGLAAGVAAALVGVRASAHLISDLLFGLTAVDAANIAAAGLLMITVALVACFLPARRATRIDPLAAIRHE